MALFVNVECTLAFVSWKFNLVRFDFIIGAGNLDFGIVFHFVCPNIPCINHRLRFIQCLIESIFIKYNFCRIGLVTFVFTYFQPNTNYGYCSCLVHFGLIFYMVNSNDAKLPKSIMDYCKNAINMILISIQNSNYYLFLAFIGKNSCYLEMTFSFSSFSNDFNLDFYLLSLHNGD